MVTHPPTEPRRAPPDRGEPAIDLDEKDEVNYVAKKYGVTPERVREVARMVGSTFAAIEEALSRTDPHASD
jgi:Protein of unknown function (DUF3606)